MKNFRAHLAVLFANLFFGVNFSSVQYITKNWVQPFGLNVIRVSVCSFLLWLMLFFVPTKAAIRKEHIGRFILCALTGVVINQMLFIKGLSMTLSIHAALLILVTPIFITLVASWLGREPLTVLKIAGLFSGIAGAVLLVLEKDHTTAANASNVLWGDILVIINAISYAFYFVLVKPLMKAYNPVHVIRWIFLIGLIISIPIGWKELDAVNWHTFTWKETAILAFIVMGATFFAYLFNLYGIHHLGASVTGSYIYTQPFFAAIIAVLLLGETVTRQKVLAAVLIIGGVLLVSFKRKFIVQTS